MSNEIQSSLAIASLSMFRGVYHGYESKTRREKTGRGMSGERRNIQKGNRRRREKNGRERERNYSTLSPDASSVGTKKYRGYR